MCRFQLHHATNFNFRPGSMPRIVHARVCMERTESCKHTCTNIVLNNVKTDAAVHEMRDAAFYMQNVYIYCCCFCFVFMFVQPVALKCSAKRKQQQNAKAALVALFERYSYKTAMCAAAALLTSLIAVILKLVMLSLRRSGHIIVFVCNILISLHSVCSPFSRVYLR